MEQNDEEVTTGPSIPLASSSNGRASGKNWKERKSATRRSHLGPGLKAKSFEDRMKQTVKEKAVKKLVTEMKEEKAAAETARKQKIVERRKAKEEKTRLEAMRAKMSARRVERLKRKAGRSKKVNQ